MINYAKPLSVVTIIFFTLLVTLKLHAETIVPTIAEIKDGFHSNSLVTQRRLALYLTNSSPSDPEIFKLYQQLLETDSAWSKAISATKIIENREQIYRAHFLLREHAKDKHEIVRRSVIYALGKEPMEADREIFIEALKDKDLFVRGLAVEGLGNFKVLTKRNIREIEKRLNDQAFWVRKRARAVMFGHASH